MTKPRKKAAARQPSLKNLAPTKQPKGGKQKVFNPTNFQFKTGGLP